MSARVERYTLGPFVEEQGGPIRASSHAHGPQPERPHVPQELLDYLRKRFPNRAPEEGPADGTIVRLAKVWGQQELIEHLEALRENPNKEK